MEHNNNISNSDTSSSAETDHNAPENHGGCAATSSGGARSYECSFCKRGFTNAQALGGHMNIHRKDKAKAKPTKPKTHRAQYPLIQTFNSNDLDNGNPVFGGRDMKYHVYFPPSDRIIQTGTTNFQYNDYLPVWRPDQLNGNLSLRIGLSCPPVEDHQVEDQIDLELRLGQYP